MALETKTIGDLPAAAAIDGTELIEVEQGTASRKISADIPRIDDLDAMVTLDTAVDQLRISQGASDHKRMTVNDFLVAAGITAYSESVDMSAADYDQASAAAKQVYSITTGAGSKDFNMLALADQEGCRVRCVKVDTGAGVANVNPSGAETFLGGATQFPLRKQGDFIEYEVVGGVAIVIDSLSTLNSEALANNQIQNLAHGCGVIPKIKSFYPITSIGDAGYSAGDVAKFLQVYTGPGVDLCDGLSTDATYINTHTGVNGERIRHKTTNAFTTVTIASWFYRVQYTL